jgi:hypothetical protein
MGASHPVVPLVVPMCSTLLDGAREHPVPY